MHRLGAYQVSEALSSGQTVISSSYASVAPDRTALTVSGGSQQVWIGRTLYTRDAPDQPWRSQGGLPPNRVPSFVWDYFAPLDNARVVGEEMVNGVATTVISAFGNKLGTAIWFRFDVDSSGLARRVEMVAPGHFMTDVYVSFAAIDIAAPRAPTITHRRRRDPRRPRALLSFNRPCRRGGRRPTCSGR